MEKEEKKKHTHDMSLPLNLHASTHRGKHTSAAVVKPGQNTYSSVCSHPGFVRFVY